MQAERESLDRWSGISRNVRYGWHKDGPLFRFGVLMADCVIPVKISQLCMNGQSRLDWVHLNKNYNNDNNNNKWVDVLHAPIH